jgi:hypothetical protein
VGDNHAIRAAAEVVFKASEECPIIPEAIAYLRSTENADKRFLVRSNDSAPIIDVYLLESALPCQEWFLMFSHPFARGGQLGLTSKEVAILHATLEEIMRKPAFKKDSE